MKPISYWFQLIFTVKRAYIDVRLLTLPRHMTCSINLKISIQMHSIVIILYFFHKSSSAFFLKLSSERYQWTCRITDSWYLSPSQQRFSAPHAPTLVLPDLLPMWLQLVQRKFHDQFGHRFETQKWWQHVVSVNAASRCVKVRNAVSKRK